MGAHTRQGWATDVEATSAPVIRAGGGGRRRRCGAPQGGREYQLEKMPVGESAAQRRTGGRGSPCRRTCRPGAWWWRQQHRPPGWRRPRAPAVARQAASRRRKEPKAEGRCDVSDPYHPGRDGVDDLESGGSGGEAGTKGATTGLWESRKHPSRKVTLGAGTGGKRRRAP
jgi:hypothetical protein